VKLVLREETVLVQILKEMWVMSIHLYLLIIFCFLSICSNGFHIRISSVLKAFPPYQVPLSSPTLASSILSPSSSLILSLRRLKPLLQTPSDTSPVSIPATIEFTTSSLAEDDEGFLSQIIFRNFQDIQMGEVKKIGIIGTRNLSPNHQQMIELLSYALVLSGNHVITSGGGSANGTNFAVIRGALRACNPDLLTVILPQSLSRQSAEVRQLLSSVTNVIELPENDAIPLKEAVNICNYQIFGVVEKIIVFAYHNSYTILNSVRDFEKTIETIKFYLD